MIPEKKITEISSPKQWKNLPMSELIDSGYPVYGANGVIGYYSEYNHENRTIAITCRGATCGNIHLTQPRSYITSNAMALDNLDESQCNIEYLAIFLKKRGLNDVVSGSAQPQITRTNLERVAIPLPALNDQIRIATLLSRVETLITTRKDNLRLLDEFLKSTFLEMFGDPVMNEKGWELTPMPKIGKFISGGTPSKEREDYWCGNFPWVSPKDMKCSYIADSQDHISETVFKETSLKVIQPQNLLIVVRGMILAHSFPLAINSVPVAINQDMKAIQPSQNINVRYLMACLDGMKRQVLVLISSAGHGTKKFDSLAMNKVMVPVPPLPMQEKFAAIVEKVESLKKHYQQNLTELENLYGALSQLAFKGELDLNRVPLAESGIEANKGFR